MEVAKRLTEEEIAREDKIKKYQHSPNYYENIFQLSNNICEGGCEYYMTFEEEEAGWGMCMNCKEKEMK